VEGAWGLGSAKRLLVGAGEEMVVRCGAKDPCGASGGVRGS